MFARDLITDLVPPLKTSDSVDRALHWMTEFRVNHLPIVNNRDFLGLISEDDILDLNEPEEPIGNQKLSLKHPFVYEAAHLYEVLKLIDDQKLTVVPVLDEDERYLGLITLEVLVHRLANMSSVTEPGGIVVLEMGVRDYSLSEIARIVESNNARILSVSITSQKDSTKIDVVLKINQTDLTYILNSFERFDYHVKATVHQDIFKDDSKDRYDEFMKYLNI